MGFGGKILSGSSIFIPFWLAAEGVKKRGEMERRLLSETG